jgi:DNA-binding winged helix-turn-helix (wHTH) protein
VELTKASHQVVSFGRYRLDRGSGRLLRGRRNVPLRFKTFAVLEYLAAHPGRLVAKDELLDAVWSETHVTPSVLAGCVRELRQALGDDARAARFIETAHGRGYRFIATPAGSAGPFGWGAQGPIDPPLPPARDVELADLARSFAQAVVGVIRRREAAEFETRRAAARRARRARPGGRAIGRARRPR